MAQAKSFYLLKQVCYYLQPIDYLDMANLSTYFAYRIANIYNKLYSITSSIQKTASRLVL